MLRREFLNWFLKITGGYFVTHLTPSIPSPLTKINTTLFSDVYAAEPCSPDTCTKQDNCGETDTIGHTCEQKDVCETDASGDCKNDECTSDSSLKCTNDTCISDKSGDCNGDNCASDSSGTCSTDECVSDASGKCSNDTCIADSSQSCSNDSCRSDKSHTCVSDTCVNDESGACTTDSCISDKSGDCANDTCVSDRSGKCSKDFCISDSSGNCNTDNCRSDSSGNCVRDTCTSDSSNTCNTDSCEGDASGNCHNDQCNSDYSGGCKQQDVCVLDKSSTCDSDLCRDDKSPAECTTSDTCALDLAMNINPETTRRRFAQKGLNKAMKWLYRLSSIILFIALVYGESHAETVIDNTNAVLYPSPIYKTSKSVKVPNPVGPFLRDCDGDGILEADTNGDGQCAGDPKVKDYDGDGTKELPPGTPFSGNFQFTCFHIPSDVAIVTTGPLTIKTFEEVAIFGAMRLSSGIEISSLGIIDNRTSAWLSETGNITFVTALDGELDETQIIYPSNGTVTAVEYTSACDPKKRIPEKPTDLTAQAIADEQIVLGWKDNSNNEKGFKIYRKQGTCSSNDTWVEIRNVDENVTTYTDKGLTAAANYSYRVMAYNKAGSAPSKCISEKTGVSGTPNSPTNLKAVSLSTSKIKLTWNDNSGDEKNFKIYRMAGTTTASLLSTVDANTETYTDTTAQGNDAMVAHSYYIKACNKKGCSPATNVAEVPFSPISLTGFSTAPNEVYLNWIDRSGNATAFEIYRKTGNCAAKTPWNLVIKLITNKGSFCDVGLVSGTTYSYRIRAYRRSPEQPYAYGFSDYSNCFEVTMP